MATPRVEISELPTQTVVEPGNWLVVDDGGTTKKIDIALVGTSEEPVADAHIADPTAAHAASAISAVAGGGALVSNNVQGQLSEAATAINADVAALAAHLADTTDAHDASAISVPADSLLTGTTVEAQLQQANDQIATNTTAIDTVQDDLQGHIDTTVSAHDASSISFVPTGTIAATNVQDALVEISVEGGSSGGGGGAVSSVNGHIGAVVLNAADVGADSAGTALTLVNDHIGDATAAHAASAVSFSPTGSIAGTTAQTAIAEVATDAAAALAAHEAGTTAIHGIANTALLVVTSDPRLTDARTPSNHASSHADGGADELSLDGSQIVTGLVADARIASTIARDSEVSASIATHAAATDPHGDRAYALDLVDDLSGVSSPGTARTNLGLGSLATLNDVTWGYMPAGSTFLVKQASDGSWPFRPTARTDINGAWLGYPGLTDTPSGALADDEYKLRVP